MATPQENAETVRELIQRVLNEGDIGFAAFKNHLSYLPHSGSVIPKLVKETEGYTFTRGSLHFAIDKPLPKMIVKKLLALRMDEAFGKR